MKEYAKRSKEINQKYLCITDHGVMGAIPQQISQSEEHGLFPIFGCETYINRMQPQSSCREETAEFRKNLPEHQQKLFDKSNHLLLIAYNNQGYQNLVRLTSWAWRHGFYKKPRINWDMLMSHRDGLIATSTCANSEIANAFFRNLDDQEGFDVIEQYMAAFGDKFFLELMMLDFKLQKPYDAFLLRAHAKYGIPLIMTQDCFVAGTLVLTNQGYKPIEEIRVGDLVLTHKKRWREVEIVGSRPLREGEVVYRVKTAVGTYAYEATGNHNVYVARQNEGSWSFDWEMTQNLKPDVDHLVIPKIDPQSIFANAPMKSIDILPFLEGCDYQVGEHYESSRKGNMSCRLQYLPNSQEFVSYRGWNRSCKSTVPRHLPVDEDLLKVIGWYIAEGWSEKSSNQVGFALHQDEQDVADWIIGYFDRFGIIAKTYQVSEKGIAVRFSSVVFNRFFGQLCGFGANNKHLPCPDKITWMKRWSRQQLAVILKCYWLGDGGGEIGRGNTSFHSTSKILILDIWSILSSVGIPCSPTVRELKHIKPNWADSWSIGLFGNCSSALEDWFQNPEQSFEPTSRNYSDLGEAWAIQIESVKSIEYKSQVYDFQVREDHSFTASHIISSNCHYCYKENSKHQRLMLMMQNGRTIQEIELLKATGADLFELQDENLWMKSEDELNEKWESDYQDIIDYDLYKQSKANTVMICEMARGVQIDKSIKLPRIDDEAKKLREAIAEGVQSRSIPRTKVYLDRIKEEYNLITQKGFASYFLIQKMMVDEARRICPELLGFGDGSEAVGPGRGCLTSDTPIRLSTGQTIPLSDVHEGDLVFTVDGTVQPVERVLSYPLVGEKILRIKTYYGDSKGVALTLDHTIYSEKGLRPKGWDSWSDSTKASRRRHVDPTGSLEWRRADEVEVGDWCFVPHPVVSQLQDYSIDLAQFSTGCYRNGKKLLFDDHFVWHEYTSRNNGRNTRVHERWWTLDERWAVTLGCFVGDGWTRSNDVKQVAFCNNKSNGIHLDFVRETFESFGVDWSSYDQGEKDVEQIVFNSPYMRDLFDLLHPNYSHTPDTKHVPDCILAAPLPLVQAYLTGYFWSDGHEDKHKVKWDTVSPILAEQIRFLLLRLGIPSSITSGKRLDQRFEFSNTRTTYTITCPLDKRIGCSRDTEEKYTWRQVDGGILLMVRSVEEEEGPDVVFDLQVKNNHNYLTSSFLVHNSVCGSLIAYSLWLHDVNPIEHDLLFSRFLSPARGGKTMRVRFTQNPIVSNAPVEVFKEEPKESVREITGQI